MFTNSEIAHDISNVIVKIDERIYAVCDGDYYKSDFYSETELHRDTNIFKAFHFIFFFFFFLYVAFGYKVTRARYVPAILIPNDHDILKLVNFSRMRFSISTLSFFFYLSSR